MKDAATEPDPAPAALAYNNRSQPMPPGVSVMERNADDVQREDPI